MEDDKPKYDDGYKQLSDKALLRFIVIAFVGITYLFILLKVIVLP